MIWQRARPRVNPLDIASAFAAGLVLGFTHLPFPISWVSALPLALVLFVIAREPRPRLAARSAFFAGLGFWSVHLFWLPQSFSALFHAPVLWAVMPLLWIAEALFWVAGGALGAWIGGRRPLARLAALAGLFVLIEFVRAHFGPIAFPWGEFGYTLLETPLAQAASLGGVALLSSLVIAMAAGLAALGWSERRPLIVAGLVWTATLIFGLTRNAPPTPTEPVLLVQGNIDIVRRTRSIGSNDLETYRLLSQNIDPQMLVVWPEGAVLLEDAQRANIPKLLSGVLYYLPDGSSQNSVALLKNGHLEGLSAKFNPVPFGEYFPLRNELAFIYDPIFAAIGQPGLRGRGLGATTQVLVSGQDRLGAYVCYDSVFYDSVRSLVTRGANVLVNVSNDGWFGDTWGVYQHFAMGRMRAIETDRYILRAGNTGISAVIDPRGRITAQAERKRALTLSGRYTRVETLTPYMRIGNWATPVFTLLGLSLAWFIRRQRDQG